MFNRSAFIALTLGLNVLSAKAAVWNDTKTWTPAFESEFSTYVQRDFNEDVFMKGKWAGISTDCADAVYVARMIFAFENQLPFSILDPTGGSKMLTNKMSRFDASKNPVDRVRQFAAYVSRIVGTKTLPRDSYPVAIDRQFIKPGAIWSRPRITSQNFMSRIFGGNVQELPGHAELVKDVTDTGVIYLIGSTVPAAVRPLITTSSLVFLPNEHSTGLRNFMQPEHYTEKLSSLPGYSLEQFDMGKGGLFKKRNLNRWQDQVQDKLALRKESEEELAQRLATDLCTMAQARIDVIQKGVARKQAIGNTCMNAQDYDLYSTPSRDKRFISVLEDLLPLGNGAGQSGRLKSVQALMDQSCRSLNIQGNQSIALSDFAEKMLDGKASSDPNVSLDARWGIKTEKSGCPEY